MKNAHSAEELARLSTLVHNVVGWALLALALALLAEVARGVPAGRARFAWPALGLVVGGGLAAYLFTHMMVTHGTGPFSDPVQNQHQAIGALAAAGSAIEILRRAGRAGPWASAAFPAALAGIGAVFLAHEQGTAEALVVHWALAGTLVLSGFAALAPAFARDGTDRPWRALSALLLAAAAVQLVAFEESPGAHGAHGADAAPTHDGHPASMGR